MIKIKHPDKKCNLQQEEFLTNCPPDQRRFHELLFTYGNITYRYHHQAKSFDPTKKDWEEWIEGLPENLGKSMRDMGFEKCKTMLPFTRYVMEKNDVGLEEFVRRHMDLDDYEEYISIIGSSSTNAL